VQIEKILNKCTPTMIRPLGCISRQTKGSPRGSKVCSGRRRTELSLSGTIRRKHWQSWWPSMNMTVDHIPTTGSVLESDFAEANIRAESVCDKGSMQAKKTSLNPRQTPE
jgi:hypothetical protein